MPVQKELITYTPEEKKIILDFWNARKNEPPTLSELVYLLSGGFTSDPRDRNYGYKVRLILSDAKLKAKTKEWEKVEPVIFTDDQKTFIRNNIKDQRIIDLARALFPERKIFPLGKEVRTINNYLKEIGESVVKVKQETMTDGIYEPPRTFHEILKLINIYTNAELTTQNITAFQKKCIETVIVFLHSPRFINEINAYKTIEKRRAFESEFIRLTWDKNDLTNDDINIYINLVSDTVVYADIKRQIEKLSEILDDVTDDPEGKIAMGLIEGIGKKETALDQCSKRMKEWYTILTQARSKRIDNKHSQTASLSALFEWYRAEENRKKMEKQEELLKVARQEEVKRIESLDDTILLSLGLDRSEI